MVIDEIIIKWHEIGITLLVELFKAINNIRIDWLDIVGNLLEFVGVPFFIYPTLNFVMLT